MYQEYLKALLSGNLSDCSSIVAKNLQNGITIKNLYEDIIKKALYEIGTLWEYNKITVTTEHMATSLTETVLNELFGKIISKKRVGKNVIVACVENELHEVGIKMVADVFEMNGWEARILGVNVSASELILEAKRIQTDIFALSLSIFFNVTVLEKMIEEIRFEFPKIPIIVGGQAFRLGGQELIKKYSNTFYLSDLDDVELFIHKLNGEVKNG